MTSIRRVWETHSLKSQICQAQKGKHSVLWGERVGADAAVVEWLAGWLAGQRTCAAAGGQPGAAAWTGGWVPLRLLSLPEPQACAEEDMHY